ncbi:hypothetical protein [Streptomyces sp. NBC_01718]|uniref:hypothetical protein n=1 Tax=Streptomyces sp. NBC_01718 TaxID=2975919 RepID=UPI00352E0E70
MVTGTSGRFFTEVTVATTATVPEATAVRRAVESVRAVPGPEPALDGATAPRNGSRAAVPSRRPDPPPVPVAATDTDPVARSCATGNCG